MQKARKLIERDKVDFLLGNVNSALALAMANVAFEKKAFCTSCPAATPTPSPARNCHWNVFRVCNTTRWKPTRSPSSLFKKYGKKWYFITPDYAFGHTLQEGFEASLQAARRHRSSARDLTPLGTTDFSSYLIKAQAANPDVIIFLHAGRRHGQLRSSRRCSSASTRGSTSPARSRSSKCSTACRPRRASAPGCSSGTGSSPNVPHVEGIRRRDPQEERRQGADGAHLVRLSPSAWTCALAAEQAKSLDAVKMAKALQGFKLPPEVALMPNKPFFRAGENQLMPTSIVGHAQAQGQRRPGGPVQGRRRW